MMLCRAEADYLWHTRVHDAFYELYMQVIYNRETGCIHKRK